MSSPAYQYDVFISYRRQEPDKAFARWLLKELKAAGYRVAFDEIDFSPQVTFLNEMERCCCCQASRLVVAVISPRYFASGNTEMEATITAVQGMSDRHNRLIPLIYELSFRQKSVKALSAKVSGHRLGGQTSPPAASPLAKATVYT